MKPYFTLFAILLFTCTIFSQNYKFGKVSKEELAETQNAMYPDAIATVLYREHRSYYEYRQGEGFTLYTNVYERIKIYTKEGFEWANQNFKTYNYGSDREKIENLKATTYNLEGNSVVKDKLSKSALFEERISNYYILNKFTLPNIKSGSVIEYTYTTSSPFSKIDNIDLQYTIPIKKVIVEVNVPEFYIYRNYGNPQASLNYNYVKSSKEIEIDIHSRSGVGSANYKSYNSNRAGNDAGTWTYKLNEYRLEESNIPPLKEEVYVDNLDNYRAKSVWELAVINIPNSVPKTYSTDWESVTKRIYETDAFLNQLNKKDYYQEDLALTTADLTDPMEKAASIFQMVKNKMTWDGYHGYFPEKGVKKAYIDGTGNVAEINLMLVSMLRSAKLNANPLLVSTKSNGIPVFPTLDGFNYVIAGLEFNGELYLMDATSLYSDINMLPRRAMNWQGRLIKADGNSSWVGLYPDYLSKDIIYAQAEIIGTDVKVKIRERLTGHFAMNYRSKYSGISVKEQLEGIQPGASIAEFKDLEVKDLNNGKLFVDLSFKATSSSMIDEINDELYLSPMLFFAQLKNPFKNETRDYPLFFGYPKTNKYTITIKVPEGYKVTSIPESSKATLANDLGSYTYLIKEAMGSIQLSVVLELKSSIVLSDEYSYVKGMFSEIITKENEKIVLSKI
jgi:transglutaminase-like putative cysteine protease